MAKKRHWKKRVKIQERASATENAQLGENGENKGLNSTKRSQAVKDSMQNRKDISDDKLLSTKEVCGETCLEIDCGSNKAQLYLSKMCLGSKGACILFKGSWLTPNEFQFVSGRENAKDWKRSIRHNGSSLKLLLTKNLIKIQASPKKAQETSEEKENNEQLLPKLPTVKPADDQYTETDTDSCTTVVTTENEGGKSATQSTAAATVSDRASDTGATTETSRDDRQNGATETEMPSKQISLDKETDLAKTEERNPESPLEDHSQEPAPEVVPEPALEPDPEPRLVPEQEPVLEPTDEPTAELVVDTAEECKTELIVDPAEECKTELVVDPAEECKTELVVDPAEECKTELVVDPAEECKTELETDMQVEDETTQDIPPVQPAARRAKRRKKKGTKKGWARQKSRTAGQGRRSRQASPVIDDLPVEETPCAYESLTEEDKLAVFVKALRLARKRDVPEPISNILEQAKAGHDHLRPHSDIEDREMPVLEREVFLVVPHPAREPSHPNIFPSTVTPPPTPPLTESPDIDEIKRELKTIDQSVFESRLSPVEDGIKLKINRLFDESAKAKESTIETAKQDIKPESVQINPVVKTEHASSSVGESQPLKNVLNTSSSFSEKAFMQVKSCESTGVLLEDKRHPTDNVPKQECVVDRRKSEGESVRAPLMPDFSSANQRHGECKTGTSPMKANIKQENFSNAGISMLRTPYGPMLMSTEENLCLYHELLAAYSTMQHSLIQPHSPEQTRKPCSSSSKTVSTVCSVNAQQLSAKTASNTCSAAAQQLSTKAAYQQGKSALFEGPNFHPRNSSVNTPRNNQVTMNSQRVTSQHTKYEHSNWKDISAHVAKYEYMNSNGITTHVPKFENMDRKRKNSDCDGALDLSVKKPKVETAVTKAPQPYNYVIEPQDSPLDFSMKRKTCNSATPAVNKQNFVYPIQRINSGQVNQFRTNTSFHPVLNKVSAQADKTSSTPSNRYVHNKSAYSSQADKSSSIPSSQNVHNKSAYSSQADKSSGTLSSQNVYNKSVYNSQADKSLSIPSSQNVHNKSAYNSLWYCVTRQLDKDMSKWTVDQVCLFLGCLDGCGDYMQIFRDQGISGKMLPFLTTQHLTRTLGMKVGPALTLQYAIGRFFKDSANPNHLSSRARVSV